MVGNLVPSVVCHHGLVVVEVEHLVPSVVYRHELVVEAVNSGLSEGDREGFPAPFEAASLAACPEEYYSLPVI